MIVRAGWVVPITAPPIRDGVVEFQGSTIERVGAWSQLRDAPVPEHHFPQAVLLPGFVNPHTHLELTMYAGLLPPSAFGPWIGRLAWLRRELDTPERIEASVRAGARECLRHGITCVGDISRRNQSWRTLKQLPIRKVCFAELLSLADHPPRTPAELQAAVESIEEDGLLTAGVSPHAPYTVPIDDVRAAIALAARINRPWTLHLGETHEELAFLAGDEAALPDPLRQFAAAGGIRSPHLELADYLQRVAGDAPRGSLAHMNYAGRESFETLARLGHSVVYCPGAHRFFGHSRHPFRDMQGAGVAVALGTDSAASNTGLSMLAELRLAQAAEPDLPADVLLRMATLDGARALGLGELIGSLEAGKQADLAVFELAQVAAEPLHALLAIEKSASAVWVAGRLDFVGGSS